MKRTSGIFLATLFLALNSFAGQNQQDPPAEWLKKTRAKVLRKVTHQGLTDQSAWARGQAWGLYGYAMCYANTKNPKFLKQAEHIAAFIMNHPRMPKDKVPVWDFDVHNAF